MYKLIFADDEEVVRNNIARLIDWESCGFKLIGCCANGHDLLELVEKETPDLVITDIDMPFLTGIEAAQQIKKNFPAIKIVFLTGYNDFSYAQKAIDLKVMKYILKPVTAQGMAQSLQEIREVLDDEYQQSTDRSRLEEFYQQNLPMLQSVFLNSLFTDEVDGREAEKKIKFLKLNQLERKQFQVAVIMSDPIPEGNEFSDRSKDLADFAIYNISKEIIETNNIGTVLFSSQKVIAIAGYDDAEKQQNIFCNCLEEIRSAIEMHLNFTVTIGKGCVYEHWSELHNSYHEALAALNYSNLVGNNRVIFIKDIEPRRRSTAVSLSSLERDFLTAVKLGDIQGAKRAVEQSLKEVEQGNGGISQQRSCILTILMALNREAENIGIFDSQIVTESEMKNVFDMWNINEMETLALNSAEKLMNCIAQNRKNSCTAVIEQAKSIIAERYKDPDLSLDDVCDALHLSASYFRALFKKETGKTFVNYLTDLRMEKAKDLILTTAMKNYEVATETGYIDPHYFSYCFKKHFKMSPNELRESVNSH